MKYGISPFMFVADRNYLVKIEIEDILYVECDCYISAIVMLDGKKYNTTKPLSYYESELPRCIFYRINRSCIVSLRHVLSIKNYGHKAYCVYMRDGKSHKVSYRRWKDFKRFLIENGDVRR